MRESEGAEEEFRKEMRKRSCAEVRSGREVRVRGMRERGGERRGSRV